MASPSCSLPVPFVACAALSARNRAGALERSMSAITDANASLSAAMPESYFSCRARSARRSIAQRTLYLIRLCRSLADSAARAAASGVGSSTISDRSTASDKPIREPGTVRLINALNSVCLSRSSRTRKNASSSGFVGSSFGNSGYWPRVPESALSVMPLSPVNRNEQP